MKTNAQILDDQEFIRTLDPSRIFRLAEQFPLQCAAAIKIATKISAKLVTPNRILWAGMGGSAAAGDLVKSMVDSYGTCPVTVWRDYGVPNWVDAQTLILISSYSGDTEETLSAYHAGMRAGAQIAVISSGGALSQLAYKNKQVLVTIPSGQPPRTAFGYMLLPALQLCVQAKVLPNQPFGGIEFFMNQLVKEWGTARPTEINAAKALAVELSGTIPLIYGTGGWQAAVANRWKCQLNENAKTMAFAQAFPELNHNELVGSAFAGQSDVRWSCIYLRSSSENPRNGTRAEVTRSILSKKLEVHEVKSRGESLLENILCLVLLGDFVSLYLSVLNKVDPAEIDAIHFLKKALAQTV